MSFSTYATSTPPSRSSSIGSAATEPVFQAIVRTAFVFVDLVRFECCLVALVVPVGDWPETAGHFAGSLIEVVFVRRLALEVVEDLAFGRAIVVGQRHAGETEDGLGSSLAWDHR